MQTTKSRPSALACAMAATLFISAAGSAFAQGLPPRIRIGASQPLTGVGAENGQSAKTVLEMVVKEINAAGGMGGRQVDLLFGDDAADPTRAVTEAIRLIEKEQVRVLLGPGIAAVALATSPIVNKAKVVSFPFSGTKAINATSFPYGFAPYYPSDAFVEALVDYAVDKLKAKTVALMVDTGAQGKVSTDVAKEYAPKRGVRITSVEAADFDATDYTPQVLNLKRGNPDVVLQVTSYANGVGYFFKATEEQNWKVKIVGQNSSNFPDQVQKIAGADAFKGGRMIGLTPKALTICPGEDPTKSPFVQFREKVKAYSPSNWEKIVNPITPAYSDQLYLLKAAIDATKTLDAPTLAQWIEKNGSTVPAITGKISTEKGDHFMFHADIFAFTTRPDVKNAQGLAVREGC